MVYNSISKKLVTENLNTRGSEAKWIWEVIYMQRFKMHFVTWLDYLETYR